MTGPDYRDPSREYPPTRPTFKTLLVAAAIVAAAAAFLNWPRVSAFAHIAQIESAIGHVVGL